MLFRFVIIVHILFSFFLVVSGYSYLIDPNACWIPAFFGLLYPFILSVNMLWGCLWLFTKKKRLFLISLISIGATWGAFCDTFSFSASSWTEEEWTILTWNVKNFDLYDWNEEEDTREQMLALLEEELPDVLCLQEFYTEDKGNRKNIKAIKKLLGYKYYFFGKTYSIDNRHWGAITFSNYPVVETGQISIENERLNTCIYTDIKMEDDIIRVYNVHLKSNHLSYDDYSYLEALSISNSSMYSSKQIVSKLKVGYQERANQAEEIANHIAKHDGRVIVCGDFNDTPVSYAYRILSENMQDAFSKEGMGFGKTYVNPTPFFRIDYVLADSTFDINRYETIREEYSDHYPVKVTLNKKSQIE